MAPKRYEPPCRTFLRLLSHLRPRKLQGLSRLVNLLMAYRTIINVSNEIPKLFHH